MGAQHRGLLEAAREVGLAPMSSFLLEEQGQFRQERALDQGSEYVGLSDARALAQGALASFFTHSIHKHLQSINQRPGAGTGPGPTNHHAELGAT